MEVIREIYLVTKTEYAYTSNNEVCVNFIVRLPAEFETVAEMVCKDLRVNKNVVVGDYTVKNRRIVLARDCIMAVLRYRYEYTTIAIGKLMRTKGHATVVRAGRRVCKENLPKSQTVTLFQFYQAVKQQHPNFRKVYKTENNEE